MPLEHQKLSEKQIAYIANLITLNDEQVISLIQDFRENGDLFIVEPLIEMLFAKRSKNLNNSIYEFLIDIKDQASVPIIARSIRNHISEENVAGLVSVCWQSRLDFSAELPIFFDILCNGDYLVAFEALTVIENSLGGLNKDQLNLHLDYLKQNLNNTKEDKQPLLVEMVKLIENFDLNERSE